MLGHLDEHDRFIPGTYPYGASPIPGTVCMPEHKVAKIHDKLPKGTAFVKLDSPSLTVPTSLMKLDIESVRTKVKGYLEPYRNGWPAITSWSGMLHFLFVIICDSILSTVPSERYAELTKTILTLSVKSVDSTVLVSTSLYSRTLVIKEKLLNGTKLSLKQDIRGYWMDNNPNCWALCTGLLFYVSLPSHLRVSRQCTFRTKGYWLYRYITEVQRSWDSWKSEEMIICADGPLPEFGIKVMVKQACEEGARIKAGFLESDAEDADD